MSEYTYYSSSDISTSEEDELLLEGNSALTLSCFKFTHDKPIDEEKDMHLFEPDGKIISFVNSNFKKTIHPDWKDIINPERKRKTNQGRKTTKKVKKIRKKNNGDGDKFHSSIDFGVIHEGKSYSIKIFRKNSCTFPSNSYNYELCTTLLDKLFTYINNCKPGANLQLKTRKLDLKNMKYVYNLCEKYPNMNNPTINLMKFKKLVVGSKNKLYFDNDIITLYFNNQYYYLKGIYNETTSEGKVICNQFKLNAEGFLFVFGGKNVKASKKIAKIIFSLLTYLSNSNNPEYSSVIQNGFKTKQNN